MFRRPAPFPSSNDEDGEKVHKCRLLPVERPSLQCSLAKCLGDLAPFHRRTMKPKKLQVSAGHQPPARPLEIRVSRRSSSWGGRSRNERQHCMLNCYRISGRGPRVSRVCQNAKTVALRIPRSPRSIVERTPAPGPAAGKAPFMV